MKNNGNAFMLLIIRQYYGICILTFAHFNVQNDDKTIALYYFPQNAPV